MNTANAVKILKSSPDYRLILSVLEKRIFEDTDMENCVRFLRQEKIWKNLDSDMQLKWSCLGWKGWISWL